MKRLLVSFVLALLLPFPGPHIDRYTPVIAVFLRSEVRNAPMGFFVLAAIVIAIYTAVVFGVLTLVLRKRR